MDRIEFISSLTEGSNTLVDVGCDHALTSILSIKKYHVGQAFALDLNDGPLESAKENIKQQNLSNQIKVLQSDGLKSFTESADCLVITGMGGILISNILNDSLVKVRNFNKIILGPNSDVDKLRYFLINSRINIEDEFMIKDHNHYYEIIVCSNQPVVKKYNYFDMLFGPIQRVKKSLEFIEFYQKKLDNSRKALEHATDKVSISKLKMDIAMYRSLIE